MLPLGRDHLRDALSQLRDWSGDAQEIRRTLRLDDSEHADLTERIKVVSDALQLWPDVRRLDGFTQIRLSGPHGSALTEGEVTLAARIDAACRAVRDSHR